ncbi:MAG TPA: toll/interleukin-1 receptor domain-containing protein [Bryobacteraceae bacterium]|nr:toll/interleukin-1 receptor domain-containing protein [Bryobacteraceae bacterium]
MQAEPSRQSRHFDAFFSHASQDYKFASGLVHSLNAANLKVWFDDSKIRVGALLRNQLQSAIRDSRVLVLLWSEDAYRSRWVMAEMFTAFHLSRLIIPCVIDETPLPQFLENSVYLDRRRDETQIAEKLGRAIREAPAAANEFVILPASQTPLLASFIKGIAAGQYAVLEGLEKDFQKAADANGHVDSALETVKKMAPQHPDVLNLAGYQCKNNYIIKHWDAIRDGRAPKDELLDRGERYFFETLCYNPAEASAVNGLGSILLYERELDAAEFFVRRAIELVQRSGGQYEAAQRDLELILSLKLRQTGTAAGEP